MPQKPEYEVVPLFLEGGKPAVGLLLEGRVARIDDVSISPNASGSADINLNYTMVEGAILDNDELPSFEKKLMDCFISFVDEWCTGKPENTAAIPAGESSSETSIGSIE